MHAVAYWGGTIYVGGEFTRATWNGSEHRRNRLAAIDAATGALLDWTPSADGTVTDIAVDSSGLYLVGDFQAVNGKNRDNLAQLDPHTGRLRPVLEHRIYGHPKKVAVGHGRVYIGGTITSVDGQARSGAAAFDAASGALDQTWAPVLSGSVHSLLVSHDRVYLGGKFDDVNGVERTQKLAAVTPDTGQVDTSFVSRVHAFVNALQIDGDTLYAGVDGDGGRAEAMDLSGGPKWRVTLDGDVQTIAILDGLIYLGGHFDNVCRSESLGTVPGRPGSQCVDGSDQRIKLAAVDAGGVLQPWTANASGTIGVRAMAASPELGQLTAGGFFKYIGGASQPRFALFTLPL
ncbi:PQQ-binding-like beta-propeller repeat protein [Allorhizocola rhizosphaerae]|uniref:outer membrane protein assembly factor BamB family protein n=1 Tax=Allorhizocola rhizosphaerae TaxID=1872709 RepID=UPI0013C2ABF9|nr:PQQ-binding-like beta-propeller repeat protein [Allorhizocola rhizosphaerae]